jgi:ketosteroid isomerase-like protein
MASRKQELHALTHEFLDAFNRNDLNAVMEFFSHDAVYDELDGTRSVGKAEIKAAFTDQFTGKFGAMTFLEDDTFIDADAGKVMSSWFLNIRKKDGLLVLRGLDLLVFEGRKVRIKQTYVKAKSALYESAA